MLAGNLTAEDSGAFAALDLEIYRPAKQQTNGVGLSIGYLLAGGAVEGEVNHD
jgi:hypothetical protein